jgi:GH15 family glucan-1,4-alpha-glucosidase
MAAMTVPLEDYAMIGDCESAALVSRSGSIDWLCWPRFDSDACFAALVGDADNGQWLVCPKDDHARATHRYRGDSLILETEFASQSGAVRLTDFMPIRDGPPALVRIVSGLRGSCELNSILRLRFGLWCGPAMDRSSGPTRDWKSRTGDDGFGFRSAVRARRPRRARGV